jgi:hypothetical protein
MFGSEFQKATPRLRALTALNTPEQGNQLVYYALGEYLAELRDRETDGRPPKPGVQSTIDRADLTKFTFTEFLARQYPSEAVPKGYLTVISVPPGAEIMINGEKKGYTDKPLVIRPGTHQVSVRSSDNRLSCTDKVEIQRDQPVKYRCPRE